MKKVCLNRLKGDVDRLQGFINSIEHQEETLEMLFQCILRLFENEMQQGGGAGQNSVLDHMTATNGLLNSQSSIFNSKANISGLDSVGMSFGRATDDGMVRQVSTSHLAPVMGSRGVRGDQAEGKTGEEQRETYQSPIVNLNRQYKTERNIIGQQKGHFQGHYHPNQNNLSNLQPKQTQQLLYQHPGNQQMRRQAAEVGNFQALADLESEVVHMGELFGDRNRDKHDLQARMAEENPSGEHSSSPTFNNQDHPSQQTTHKMVQKSDNVYSRTSAPSSPGPRQSHQPPGSGVKANIFKLDQTSGVDKAPHGQRNNNSNINNNFSGTSKCASHQVQLSLNHPIDNYDHMSQQLLETPYMEHERAQTGSCSKSQHDASHTQSNSKNMNLAVGTQGVYQPSTSINNQQQVLRNTPVQRIGVKESYDTMNTSKLLANLSQHFAQTIRGSRQGGASNIGQHASARSFKENIKIFVTMMVEDIWAFYEGFSWQRKLLLQSEEKKKRHYIKKSQHAQKPGQGTSIPTLHNQSTNGTAQRGPAQPGAKNTRGRDAVMALANGVNNAPSINPLCPSETEGSDASYLLSQKSSESKETAHPVTFNFNEAPPLRSKLTSGRLRTPTNYQQLEAATFSQGATAGGPNSLKLSKKSSMVSNYKMDFIDPGRAGTGMISSRNNVTTNTTQQAPFAHGQQLSNTSELLSNRYVDLRSNGGRMPSQPQQFKSVSNLRAGIDDKALYSHQLPAKAGLNRHPNQRFVLIDDQSRTALAAETSRSQDQLQTQNKSRSQQPYGEGAKNQIEMGQGKQSPRQNQVARNLLANNLLVDKSRVTIEEDRHSSSNNITTLHSNSRQYDSAASQGGQSKKTLHWKNQKFAAGEHQLRYGSRNHDLHKLTFTSNNSLVSPADLEAASEMNETQVLDQAISYTKNPKNLITDHNAITLNMIDSHQVSHQQQQQPRNFSKSQENWPQRPNGSADSHQTNEISLEMQRRLLENVAAIEKDLNLAPTVSEKIGTIQEDDDEECELSDTYKTSRERNMFKKRNQDSVGDSPDFPKRDSNDEVHRAQHYPSSSFEHHCRQQRQGGSLRGGVEGQQNEGSLQLEKKRLLGESGSGQFEECLIDYQANPFGRPKADNSRQYIDEITSSSGDISGLSQDADCLPIVEQFTLKEEKGKGPGEQKGSANEVSSGRFAKTDTSDEETAHQQLQLILQQANSKFQGKQVIAQQPFASVSKPVGEYTSQLHQSQEVKEFDPSLMMLTDKTRKQMQVEDEDEILTPNRRKQSLRDDRSTTDRKAAKKRKNNYLDFPSKVSIERAHTDRNLTVNRPQQPHVVDTPVGREQPMSVLLQNDRQYESTIYGGTDHNESSLMMEGGVKTQYETADQVVNQYQNLAFMPQKNEKNDRLDILVRSKEFNPVIEFEINSPYSSQRTSQPQNGTSSRSNSDLPHLLPTNLNQVNTSQALSHKAQQLGPSSNAPQVLPFTNGLEEAKRVALKKAQPKNGQSNLLLQASLDSAPTQINCGWTKSGLSSRPEPAEPSQKSKAHKTAAAKVADEKLLGSQTVEQEDSLPPPYSPLVTANKTVAKTTAHTARKTTKNAQTLSSKAQALNKKMMQADQHLAYAKHHTKKMQNLSASAAADKHHGGAKEAKAVSSFDHRQQTQAAPAILTQPVTPQGAAHHKSQAQTLNQTPKAAKSKQLSSQYMTLSNTIKSGLTSNTSRHSAKRKNTAE